MDKISLKRHRLVVIDSVRGLIIVLMILEHSRQLLSGRVIMELPGIDAFAGLSTGGAAIRFLSHLCAPGFFFLLGVSATLAPSKTLRQVIQRGLLLMGLQVTVVNLGWAMPYLLRGESLADAGSPLYLGVLFTLGCTALVVGYFRRFSPAVVFAVASVIAVISLAYSQPGHGIMGLLVSSIRGEIVEVPYPLLPWPAVALFGTVFAKIFVGPPDRPKQAIRQQGFWLVSFLLGVAGSVTFYLSPEDFHKYPPSFSFLGMAGSIVTFLILLFRAVPALNLSLLQVIGRHPQLVYILHLYLLGLVAVAVRDDQIMSILVVAAAVTAICAAVVWMYESSPLGEGRRNIFDTWHRFYDLFMRLFALYRPEEVNRTLVARTGGRLLDVAGGTGYLAAQLQEHFVQVVLVDVSGAMLAVARERGLAGVRGSALSLPFAANSFTAAICTDALHHIKDADTAIKEMVRVLQKGGRIVIQEFHIKGITGWLFFVLERLYIDRSQFITPAELEALMANRGFAGTTRPISRIGYIYEGCLTSKETKHVLAQSH